MNSRKLRFISYVLPLKGSDDSTPDASALASSVKSKKKTQLIVKNTKMFHDGKVLKVITLTTTFCHLLSVLTTRRQDQIYIEWTRE